MKKIIIILCMVAAILISGCAKPEQKNTITVVREGDFTYELSDLHIEKTCNEAGVYTYVMTWTENGQSYECCMNGIREELTEEQIKQMIYGIVSGTPVSLIGTAGNHAITDAEKTSRLLNHKTGNPVVPTSCQKLPQWGDTQLCWAASLANCLYNSGWAAKAVSPLTGKPFASEDELFAYFAQMVTDDGADPMEGLRLFFTGEFYPDGGAELRDFHMMPCIEKTDFETVCHHAEPASFLQELEQLKNGAAMEMDISLDMPTHTLINDPDTVLGYDIKTKRYYTEEQVEVYGKEEVKNMMYDFVFGADGTVVVVNKTDNGYIDSDNKTYPETEVWQGALWYDETNGTYETLTRYSWDVPSYYDYAEEPFEEEEIWVRTYIPEYVSDEGIDWDSEEEAHCGKHAITCNGYVVKDDGKEKTLVSLLITDSDDNADVWSVESEAESDRKRPDVIRMLPVEAYEYGGEETVRLQGYHDVMQATVVSLVVIDSAK